MRLKLSAVALLAGAVFSTVAASPADADEGEWVIALSNAYFGNTWRHQMVEAFEEAANEAKGAGMISDFVVMNGDAGDHSPSNAHKACGVK